MKRLMPFAIGLLLSAAGLPAGAQSSGGLVLEPAAQPSAAPRATPITEDVTSPRQPYAFFPVGGNVYDDVFLQNFVDLDAAPNLMDFTGSNLTLAGQTGEDVTLRSFAEQDLGVPVFAALDGTASQAVYSDPNDHNTTGTSSGLGNYVILDSGAGQQTGYFSLVDPNQSTANTRYAQVSDGEAVRAGTQIGLAGSSGASTGPHFHLQSSLNGAIYEPFAGSSRPGPSWWTAQPVVRRNTYLEVFNVDAGNVGSPAPNSDLPRQGTFVQGTTNTGGWTILHNLPANSTFRLRWLRPDGTVYHDTTTVPFTFTGSSAFQRTLEYWWNYRWMPGLDQTGTWHLELTVNGSLVQAAPFFVVASAGLAAHRAPYMVTATLDPAQPTASDAIFCRVATAPNQDGAPVVVSPDSALVFYRYQWSVSGPGGPTLIRDATTAGHADAIPWGQANVGSTVQCVVTPMDGVLSGPTTAVSATLASRASAGIAVGPNNTPRLLWGNPAGVASLWGIDATGNHTYTTYGPYTDNAPQNKWAPTAISVGPNNGVHLLWDNTDGRVAFWNVNGDNTYTVAGGYGPFTDNGAGNVWSATALATGPDGASHILWNNTNGRVALWKVHNDGTYAVVGGYGPYTDGAPQNKWSAVGISVGPDNVTHLLWSNTDHRAAFWSIDAAGTVSVTGYGPYTDNGTGNVWSATGIATGADGISRMLWNNSDGSVALWNLDGQGSLLSLAGYGPFAGFTASAVGVGANNNPRIVWTGANGQAAVWNIDTAGNVTYSAYGL